MQDTLEIIVFQIQDTSYCTLIQFKKILLYMYQDTEYLYTCLKYLYLKYYTSLLVLLMPWNFATCFVHLSLVPFRIKKWL